MIKVVRVLLPAVLSVLGAGCASVGPQEQVAVQQQAVVNPPRSERGNPQEYEVMGRRYRVMHSGDGYRDTGVASWYGRDFHGRPTSSGERYDMFALTAAHKTLPIPTWVEVTNQRNGRAVIVKVNDRGPFVDDRIIDLSYAAALELDMINSGTAPVFVRALGAPATVPSPAQQASVAGNSRVVFAQVAAFSDQTNAQRMLSRLVSSGFDNVAIVSSARGSDSVHRVRIGPLDSDAVFAAVRDRLSGLGFNGAQMIVEFISD
ncbi:MAG: septal ring lytic transglycosylase RlpA family protein [Gammaproteobacteria bacterium]|jgi:rare lipoprotein A